MCHKAKGNRRIEVNHNLNRLKAIVRDKLFTEEGLYHRSRRPIEPEAVFGQTKLNNKFRRFTLRGIEKIITEFGQVAIAHNLRKIATIMSNYHGKTVFYCILEVLKGTKNKNRKINISTYQKIIKLIPSRNAA